MTVLCGTDFSPNATMAAHAAAAFARRMTRSLTLVHAIDELGADLMFQTEEGRVYDPVRADLRALADQLAQKYGVPVDAEVRPGMPHQVIVNVARRVEAELVVIGAIGGDKPRWLLGNQAQLIAQASPVPVLIVREGASLEAWLEEGKSLHVLVGVEPTPTAKAAVRWACHLRSFGPIDLTIARIVHPATEHRRLGAPPPSADDQLAPDVLAAVTRDLEQWARAEAQPSNTDFLVIPGLRRRDEALAQLAAEQRIDLLAVGTHRRAKLTSFWLGSVSRAVMERATVNVVVVPPSTLAKAARLPTVRSVLVPTDFTPESVRAIAFACALVGPGDTVHLVHVVTKDGANDEQQLRVQLDALMPGEAPFLGVETSTEIVHDTSVADGILHAARRHGVTMICMTAGKHSAVAQLLLGSNTAEVIRQSSRPVVLVPGE